MTLVLALALALTVSAVALGLLLRLAPRSGLMDYPGDRRRMHREVVPRIGGLAVFAGLLASLVVAPSLTTAEGYSLAGAVLLVVVGALDDRYHLGPRIRLLVQVSAGLLLTLGGGMDIPTLGDLLGTGTLYLGGLALPFTLLAIVGLINALNMIDGIDGLAAGITVIALSSLLCYLPAGAPLPLVLSATLAALVPYLLCNLEVGGCRCKVFLGDAGSMLLGYLIVWGLIAASRSPDGMAPVTALWLVAIPLMDTLAVMGRRLRSGQHPFRADRGHLHHCLARLFHCPRRALAILLSLASLLAGVGLGGQALAVPEALMFYLALACFAGYLLLIRRVPDWHRYRRKQDRKVLGMPPA